MAPSPLGVRPIRNPKSQIRNRTGLTLVELLITITIIAILAAAILGTASAAFEASRRSRTQSTIAKINGLIMERWASYETRRVELGASVSQAFQTAGIPFGGAQRADLRLIAMRELLKFEMPDRWSDAAEFDGSQWKLTQFKFLSRQPALAQMYFRRVDQAYRSLTNSGHSSQEALQMIATHQAAECLYLTVMNATGDGEARTLFSAQDVGDIDQDGLPELLDGWGNPIAWVRWPAGYVSRSTLMTGDPEADHDPFDPFHRDLATAMPPATTTYYPGAILPFIGHLRDNAYPSGFRIVPLIYSSGPDGISDINTSGPTSVISSDVLLDPYAIDPAGPSSMTFPPNADANYQFGIPFDGNQDGTDNSKDNITNHVITY